MEKRTITDEVEAYLIDIAKRLPVIPIKTKDGKHIPIGSRVLGEALIQNKITLVNGEKIQKHKMYVVNVGSVNVNHLNNLKKVYLQEGNIGISKYIVKAKTGIL